MLRVARPACVLQSTRTAWASPSIAVVIHCRRNIATVTPSSTAAVQQPFVVATQYSSSVEKNNLAVRAFGSRIWCGQQSGDQQNASGTPISTSLQQGDSQQGLNQQTSSASSGSGTAAFQQDAGMHQRLNARQQRSSEPAGSAVFDSQNLFQKGVAISVWQNSSDQCSNWTAFLKRKNYYGQHDLVEAFMESNDFWNRFEDDIQLVKATGANSFRFSFEWARIEPESGHIDQTAIHKYHDILDSVYRHGLTPNATFHHFTHPQWFEAKGGFANADNSPAFVNYCSFIFQEFGSRIPFWATFNEPSCFCLCGYIMGLWAPGQRGRIIKAGRILGNMLKAHVQVYRQLKALPYGQQAQVGLVHQHIRFVPNCNWLAGLIVRPVCKWMTYWFATKVVLTFLTTGQFRWRAPLLGTVIKFDEPAAVGALDWWGINYYSRPAINGRFQLSGLDASEPITGMGMPLVPGDMHHHLCEAYQALHVPIIVSETGVSDKLHVLRANCISSYYNEVLRAIKDGVDVRGVYYWTLMDNIEWHHGFDQHFGLYEWRPKGDGGKGRPTDGTTLQLRQGSKTLVALHKAWPETLGEMKNFAQQHWSDKAGPTTAAVAAAENAAAAAIAAEVVQLPGVPNQQQQAVVQETMQADHHQQQQDKGMQEPLLRQSGSVSDVV